MKILIAYYSRGGGTSKVAEALEYELKTAGHEVDIEHIAPIREHSIGYWFWLRSFKSSYPIKTPQIEDISSYDLLCIGSPNWTRLALPVYAYLETINGLEYKDVALFSTTAFIPSIEWYIFSAYFLDVTFSRVVDKRNARNVGNVLFSSIFTRWRIESDWGKEKLQSFVAKITSPLSSFKNYALYQKEREGLRFLVVFFPLIIMFALFALYAQADFRLSTELSWMLAIIGINGFLSIFQFLTLLESEQHESLGKYIAGLWLPIIWTLFSIQVNPEVGRGVLGGYILILVFIGIFRDPLAVVFTGVVELITIIFLTYVVSLPSVQFALDAPIISISTSMLALIAHSLKQNTLHLLSTQEDLEHTLSAIEKEKDKTSTILSHLSDGVLVFDSHKELIYANPQAVNYVTGQAVTHTVGTEEFKDFATNVNMQKIFQLVEDSVSKSELIFGENHTYEISIEPVKLDEAGPFVIMVDMHDITEKKELDAMKVDFASIAAHELRTPITTIKGYLSLLREEGSSLLDETNKEFLKRSIESTNRLNATIESLLAVTRVEKGQAIVTKERFNILEPIRETISELSPAAEYKKQQLILTKTDSESYMVLADILKVKEILVNLVNNAIKYIQDGGTIELSVREADRFVQVHVADNGPGIPEKTQKFLFRKFLRGDNPLTEQTQGVGLGLYLVKSLVELQGGSIWVNSAPGKGTTFSFSLPKGDEKSE